MTADRDKEAAQVQRLSKPEVTQTLRRFLEDFPLYRKLTIELQHAVKGLTLPVSITRVCGHEHCKHLPGPTWEQTTHVSASPGELVAYRCGHCRSSTVTFWLQRWPTRTLQVPSTLPGGATESVHDAWTIVKTGQTPAWAIEPPKAVRGALDDTNLDLYKKGLVCISQSYGIGAMGYFRRIVENAVGDLLNLVEEAARADGNEAALATVAAARERKNADEKLHLVADVVPASLRPGGVNPLARLYEDYSRGLHSLTDEECLAVATDLREAMEYVFGNIREQLEQAKAYRDRISKRKGSS